jgi:hypothetical protein
MARTAIAILTPQVRRANISRWVEAMERGWKPHANIPKETSTDKGTHSTCPADVLPISYRMNRSGPAGPGSFSQAPDLRPGGTHCSSMPTACAVAGYLRNGLRPRAGMWNLHKPGPASKKNCPHWNQDLHEPAPSSKKITRALECGTCTSQRPCQRQPRVRWNEDQHKPAPASKERRAPECGKTPSASVSKKRRTCTGMAVESGVRMTP